MRVYIDSGSLIIANDFGAIQSIFAAGSIALQPIGNFISLSDLNTQKQILLANYANIFDSGGVAYGASVQAVAVALSKVINASNGVVGGVVVNYELFADLPLTGEIEKMYYVFGETPQKLYAWNGAAYIAIASSLPINLYNNDGTLIADRTVFLDNYFLSFEDTAASSYLYFNKEQFETIINELVSGARGEILAAAFGTGQSIVRLRKISNLGESKFEMSFEGGKERTIHQAVDGLGIQYAGFGETDPDDTSLTANYNTLTNTSLVPKSFVDSLNLNNILQGGNSFAADISIGSNDVGAVIIKTNGFSRLFISNVGNVTVGGMSAPAKLTIVGNSDDAGGIRLQDNSTTDKLAIYTDGSNDAALKLLQVSGVLKIKSSAGANLMQIASNGITTLNNANTGETLAILNSNTSASGSARIDLQTQSSNVLSKISMENTGASFRINDVTNNRQFAIVQNNTLILGNTSVNSIAVDLVSSSFTSRFGNNSGAKFFVIDSAIYRFVIESDNTLTVGATPNYETLVTANNDIPNKKYVDDSVLKIGIGRIATATTTSTTLTPLTSASITVTVAGTYVANFNGTLLHSNNDINVSFVFAKNGTAVTNGLQTEAAHPSRLKSISIAELFTNLVVGDVITIRWSTASGTATLTNYTFFLEK